MGQLNGTRVLQSWGKDAESSEQQTFVNLPDSCRALKITIDLKKSNCPGSSRKWEPGIVPPSPDLENSTLKQALGSLSLTGLLKHPRWHPISGLCTGRPSNWDSFS